MAILNSVAGWAQQGVASSLIVQNLGISLSAGPQSNTLPASGTFLSNGQAVTFTKGYVRIHVFNFGASTTLALGATIGTDGTNNVTIFPAMAATAAQSASTSRFDLIFDFNCEEQLNKITVTTTLAGGTTTATMDLECVLFV